MNAHRNISSNTFGPNTQIHQGDTVIHNYSSSNESRKAYYVLPFPPNEDIICRPEIVTTLDELLSPSKEGRYCSVALWGLGGSGKTQIALDYAYRRSHEDPHCDIFWVHADDETSFAQDYHAVARKLGLDPKLNGKELFLEVRNCIESRQKWLLVLDNADDVTRFGVGATDHTNSLLKFIPGGPGGTVLWTSRDKQIVALAGSRRGIQIPHMAIEEAEKLLSTARDEDIQENEIQDAKLLLQELQWLPLAISQAGSFMRRTSTPIKAYLSRLLEGKSRWNTLKKTQHDKHRRPEVTNSILETWNISIEHIIQESFVAYQILHTIAYIDNQNIPLSLILAISGSFDELEQKTTSNEEILETVIVRLKEFSFISARKAENDAEPTFDMHKLVQDAIRYTSNTENIALEKIYSGTALSALAGLFPKEVNQETWPLCEKYATHVIQASVWTEDALEIAVIASDLMGRVAEYFIDCAFLQKAEYAAKEELRLAEISAFHIPAIAQPFTGPESLPETQTQTMTTFRIAIQYRIILAKCKLSAIYCSQELFEEAEKYALETLALAEKALGEKHDLTIDFMSLLVNINVGQGRLKKAEEIQIQQLSFQREICGEKHLKTISTMRKLAFIYEDQKLYDKAKELRVQVLAFTNETLGERHPITLDAIWYLANTYRLTDQVAEASELEKKFLSLKIESQSEEHPNIQDLESLSRMYVRQGLFRKAKSLRKRILSEQQNALGEKHLDTVLAMQDLAGIHLLNKEYKEAEDLHLKALAILQGTFGNKNEQTLLAMRNVATLYYTQNLTEKGEEFRKKAIALMMEMYDNKPPPNFLLQFEDIESLSKRRLIRQHHVTRRWQKLSALLQRRLEQRISRIELLKRRLSKQVLLVMFRIRRRLLRQRLLKLAKSIRLLNRRLLKLCPFQKRNLIQRRHLNQSLLERCALKLRLSKRFSSKQYELNFPIWMKDMLFQHEWKARLWFLVLQGRAQRHMKSYQG